MRQWFQKASHNGKVFFANWTTGIDNEEQIEFEIIWASGAYEYERRKFKIEMIAES